MSDEKAFSGTVAMAGASVLRIAIQIALLPLIGRLLGPVAYGQIALVAPFVFFAMTLAESGLGTCLVRADEATPALQGTIFCFSTALSLTIILAFAALAYPLGAVVHEPAFPALLMGMSVILLLAAVYIVPAGLLLRAKRYDIMALSDVASTVAGLLAVGLGIWSGWGVWSLIAQQIALWTAKLVVVTFAARWWPVFLFSRRLLADNLKFGMSLTASAIVGLISRNIDNILIGAFMGTLTLGFYALAFQIVVLPQMVFSGSIYYTTFQRVAAAHRLGAASPQPFLRMLRGSLLIGMPMVIGLVATAPVSIRLMLGERWEPSILVVLLLTPFGMAQTIWPILSGVLTGQGRSGTILKLGLIGSVATILAIFAGLPFGSAGVAIGVSLSALFGVALPLRSIATSYGLSLSAILGPFVPAVTSALVMGGGVLALEPFVLARMNPALALATLVAVGIVAYAIVLLGLFHRHVASDVDMFRAALLLRLRGKGVTP